MTAARVAGAAIITFACLMLLAAVYVARISGPAQLIWLYTLLGIGAWLLVLVGVLAFNHVAHRR